MDCKPELSKLVGAPPAQLTLEPVGHALLLHARNLACQNDAVEPPNQGSMKCTSSLPTSSSDRQIPAEAGTPGLSHFVQSSRKRQLAL